EVSSKLLVSSNARQLGKLETPTWIFGGMGSNVVFVTDNLNARMSPGRATPPKPGFNHSGCIFQLGRY
ncbi:hypothetical protein, partial [Thiolapillus sp.]|uniref:hypothetical protein n=1 Tax=Thiolapillus sp. TaxID=2017437 RepID=UPI003AF495EA